MLKYIISKLLVERKDTIGNIVLYSCIMSMLMVCVCIIVNINIITTNDEYKNGLLAASISDPFIREKMDAMFGIINVLSLILILFFSVLYFLKIKSDIINERQRIAMFQVLGYSDFRRGMTIFIGKMVELIIPIIIGMIIANSIWSFLCSQETFNTLMTVLDEKIHFKIKYSVPAIIILMLITFIASMWMMKRKINLVSSLKGEE